MENFKQNNNTSIEKGGNLPVFDFSQIDNKDYLKDFIAKNNNISQEIALKIIEVGGVKSVAKNLEKFEGLNQEIADKLIEGGESGVIAKNLEKFEGLNHQEIADKLIERGWGYEVANNLEKFEGLNQEIADKLIKIGESDALTNNLEKFEGLNHQEIALKIIEARQGWIVIYHLEKFKGLNYQEIADKLIEGGESDVLARNLKKFEGLNHQEIADKLIEGGESDVLAKNLEKFEGLNQEIALKLIEAGKGEKVSNYLKKFKNLNQEIALKLIDVGEGRSVVYQLKKFKGLNYQEIADKLIEGGESDVLAKNLEKFEGSNHQEVALRLIDFKVIVPLAQNIEKFENLSRDTGNKLIELLTDFSLIIKVNDYFNPPLDKMLAKALEIFGSFASFDNYNIIKGVDQGDLDIIEKLKLKKGGNDGLRELQERLSNFKKDIISEDFDYCCFQDGHNYDLYLPYFKSYIRYDEAEWGDNDEDSFWDTIYRYDYFQSDECLKDGYKKSRELNSNFKPSKEILISKSNEKERDSHQFNEHFLNRFSVLINSLKKSKELYEEKFPLTKLIQKIEERREILIQELKEKADKIPNPQAKEGISKKINLLESVNVRSLKDFQSNFSILAKNKEFNELLRQAVFLFSFSKNRQSLDYDLDQIDLNKPKLDDISWTLNFIDHITNQETMSKYFDDKKSAKLFNEVVSTKAISEEMSLMQNKGGESKDKTKIQFIPTRGILTEFSGHIADACWASKYDSILNSFPNLTSVIIRQNPETKFERLAGAFMLIETESKEGEPLLVIRGLNPIENLINSLSVKDFYEKTTDYLKELAKKDNRKLAIVIDDHSGGSATNRPVLFEYLNKLSKELEPIDLKSKNDTTFNGYNITRQTYLVD